MSLHLEMRLLHWLPPIHYICSTEICNLITGVFEALLNRPLLLMLTLGVYYHFFKGNVGASGTIREWKDSRTGELYNGFPFAVWTGGTFPVIKTVDSLKL